MTTYGLSCIVCISATFEKRAKHTVCSREVSFGDPQKISFVFVVVVLLHRLLVSTGEMRKCTRGDLDI